jgi:hypothetical protein
MGWFWNWGGECFGYRDGESLFTYFGKEAGRFDGEEIYGSNGRYLGEVMSDNRLRLMVLTKTGSGTAWYQVTEPLAQEMERLTSVCGRARGKFRNRSSIR